MHHDPADCDDTTPNDLPDLPGEIRRALGIPVDGAVTLTLAKAMVMAVLGLHRHISRDPYGRPDPDLTLVGHDRGLYCASCGDVGHDFCPTVKALHRAAVRHLGQTEVALPTQRRADRWFIAICTATGEPAPLANALDADSAHRQAATHSRRLPGATIVVMPPGDAAVTHYRDGEPVHDTVLRTGRP